MIALGDSLVEACRGAQHEAILVAPYIKASAFSRIVPNLGAEVRLTVITKWAPLDILAGVTDLEVYEMVASRECSCLYVHPYLHAKIYRLDDRCFFGSANLTRRGLGWICPSNIEVLLEAHDSTDSLRSTEMRLLEEAVKVDESYYLRVKAQTETLRSTLGREAEQVVIEQEDDRSWLPTCSRPDVLWRFSLEPDATSRQLVRSAIQGAIHDLHELRLPAGLTEAEFNKQVAATLMAIPLVRAIDDLTVNGLTDADAILLLGTYENDLILQYGKEETWEVLKKWLEQFFPQRYRREMTREVFLQGRKLR